MKISYTLPLSISADSRLSDDVLMVAPVSVDPAATSGTAVAVDEDGNTSILAVTPGVGAAELRSSKDSASGLSVLPLPEGTGAKEIIALTDQAGLLHALYATGSAVLHTRRDSDGTWSAPDTLPAGSGLTASQVPLSGDVVVSGVNADGNAVLYSASAGRWSGQTVDVRGALFRGGVRVQYLNPDGSWVMFGAAGGKLLLWSGRDTSVASGPETVSVAAPVADLLFTYTAFNSAMAVFTDSQHNLYSTVGFSDKPGAIPQAKVVRGTGCVGGDGLIRCYGCDPDGKLWVLRQTAWAKDGSPQWAPIFPLDTQAADVSSPVGASGALVVTRVDRGIDLLSQQDERGPWRRVPVQQDAAAVPLRTPRYRTRLTVTDAAGRVCHGVAVTVTPDRLVALTSGTGSTIASPDLPASLTTDASGEIEFSQPATGLHAVTFTVATPQGSAPLSITPHDYLNPVLGGHADLFTGAATVPAMSRETLLNATVDGRPLLSTQQARDRASVAADGIKQAASAAAGLDPLAPLAPLAVLGSHGTLAGYEVDLRDPAAPRFRAFHSAEELASGLAAHRAGQLGSVWDSIGQFGDDVWNAISSGAMKLVHWVVDTANKAISLAVQFSDEISARLDLALADAAQLASLVQGIFHAIEVALEKALDWLKDQFHWDSVWRTMDACHGYLKTAFDTTIELLEKSAIVKTGRFFADLKSEVKTAFDSAIAAVGDRTLDGQSSRSPSGGPPIPPDLPGGNPLQQNWVLNQLTTHLPDGSFMGDGGLTAEFIGRILGQLQKAVADSGLGSDAVEALQDLQRFFAEWFPHPNQIGQARAADLLRVVRSLTDLVLDAADIIATTVLEVIAAVLAAIEKMLDTPVTDSPALIWIWEHLVRPSWSKDEMTAGRLFCLAFAAPVTTLYLADKGRGPFDPPKGLAPRASIEEVFTYLEYFGSIVLIGFDVAADTTNMAIDLGSLEGTKVPAVINWADWIATLLIQVFAWPQETLRKPFEWDWSSMSRSDKVLNGVWIGYWAPILVDGTFNVIDFFVSSRVPFIVNTLLDRTLALLLIAGGVTGAGLAIADDEDGSGPEAVVEQVLGPLPWVGQPLLVKEVVEVTEGLSPFVQLAFDLIGDFDWSDDAQITGH